MSAGAGGRQIALLTGERGTGKTTTSEGILTRTRELGLDCAGLLCPARFDSGAKVGIDVVELRTQERRRLARVDELPGRLRAGPYRFDDEVVAWGVSALQRACPCDLLIVDEIGPLEMDRGEGWINALEILRLGEYSLALVVVRPAYLDAVRAALGAPGTEPISPIVGPGPDTVRELSSLLEELAAHRGSTSARGGLHSV